MSWTQISVSDYNKLCQARSYAVLRSGKTTDTPDKVLSESSTLPEIKLHSPAHDLCTPEEERKIINKELFI